MRYKLKKTGRKRTYERKSICFKCGVVFDRYPGKQRNKRTFCSKDCYRAQLSEDNKNKRVNQKGGLTTEEKEKIGNYRRGESNGRTYEKLWGRHKHRAIMENIIGRPLKKEEVVHHVDGNLRNNDPNNLMLFTSQAEHFKWHRENDMRYRGGGPFHG